MPRTRASGRRKGAEGEKRHDGAQIEFHTASSRLSRGGNSGRFSSYIMYLWHETRLAPTTAAQLEPLALLSPALAMPKITSLPASLQVVEDGLYGHAAGLRRVGVREVDTGTDL